MGFIHIALFGFKTDAKVEDVNQVHTHNTDKKDSKGSFARQGEDHVLTRAAMQLFNKLLALKENCVNADSGAPYIKSLVGGKDISVEELQVCGVYPRICRVRV